MVGMSKLPNPLKEDSDEERLAIKILSDRGIKQAIKQGYLIIDPEIDLANPGQRLQPASIDLSFEDVGSHFTHDSGRFLNNYCSLDPGKESWVEFVEAISFNNPIRDFAGIKTPEGFFSYFLDGRSSLLRLGAAVTSTAGNPFYSGVEATIFNTSQNNIILKKNERIAQAFIRVFPFADAYGVIYEIEEKLRSTPDGDKIRELEMGVHATNDSQLEELAKQGFMKVERKNKGNYIPWKGLILLHASKAFRTKKIEGGIEFASRDKYRKDDLLEEVDIRRKYFIKEGEHLIVEVEETFDLSPYVGMSVLNNLVGRDIPGAPKLFGFTPKKGRKQRTPEENARQALRNCSVRCIKNSWIDPGYKGMMTGFPKLLGKTIQIGDVVGYAQAFFFPKGVERPYGSSSLGSQYQNQTEFEISKC